MTRASLLRLPLAALLLALGTAHCSSSAGNAGPGDASADQQGMPDGDDGGVVNLPAPVNHRPITVHCDATRPPGIDNDAGPAGFGCSNDSECSDAGTNGRCTPSGHNGGPSCTADACAADADCGSGKVCQCGASAGPAQGRFANVCIPGNCQVDSDCGAGGFCSPTWDTSCGSYSGIIGYYCHTANDECTNDDQCQDGSPGYCAFSPAVARWVCAHGFCAG